MCDLTPDDGVTFAGAALSFPSAAREFVRGHTCAEHGTFAIHALELVTSELVTNAVLHGQPPVTLLLTCQTTEIRLAVSDAGPGLPDGQATFGHATPRRPDELGASGSLGLGLKIVAQTARDWGTTTLPVGMEVWCRVPTGMLPQRSAPGRP